MRHKYATPGLVLARAPLAEAGNVLTVLTPEFGVIRAVASGSRRSGAKLAPALQALRQSDLTLVRGKEGWRITGALLGTDYFATLAPDARAIVARVLGLLLRLVHDEHADAALYDCLQPFLIALPELTDKEAAETLVVLRLLGHLGLDAGQMPPDGYGAHALAYASEQHAELVRRINRGISAAHL